MRPATRAEHLAFLRDRTDASHLQHPGWGQVVPAWRAQSLALEADGAVVGMAQVLLRPLPGTRGALVAQVLEGPVLDWSARPAGEVLAPLADHLRARGAVSLRISPHVVVRRWSTATLRSAMSCRSAQTLREVPADATDPCGAVLVEQLTRAGWRPTPHAMEAQARFQWHVPVAGPDEGQLRARLSQEWRRGLRKEAAAGVQVRRGGPADVAAFARTHRATAARAGFPAWPDDHAARLAEAFGDDFRMYVAEQEGEVLATSVVLRVGCRSVEPYVGSLQLPGRPSGVRSLEWRAITDTRDAGVPCYDMRGIGESLDPEAPKSGMVRFKAGTGGEAVEYLGEWDLPLRPALHAAVALGRRVAKQRATWRAQRAAAA